MTASLTLHELSASPNNVRVRIALDYKGLEYDRKPFDMTDFPGKRDEIVKISGQPRLPVLVHGKTVVFDSYAIMRYLESNFPDSPKLYSTDYQQQGEIEQWELWTRSELGKPISALFGQMMSGKPDAKICREAAAQVNELTGKTESALEKHAFLVRDTLSAADLAAAPFLNLAILPKQDPAKSPIQAFFHQHLELGSGRDRTRKWIQKVMSYEQAGSR